MLSSSSDSLSLDSLAIGQDHRRRPDRPRFFSRLFILISHNFRLVLRDSNLLGFRSLGRKIDHSSSQNLLHNLRVFRFEFNGLCFRKLSCALPKLSLLLDSDCFNHPALLSFKGSHLGALKALCESDSNLRRTCEFRI